MQRVGVIIQDLVIIVILMAINIKLQYIELTTEYSKNEQKWSISTLQTLIMIFIGNPIMRASTIGVNGSSNEFQNKLGVFILYELVCNIYLVTQFFEGRTINQDIEEQAAKDQLRSDEFIIENYPIHILKKLLMTAGFIISFLIISLAILLILFMLTVCAMTWDRRNQRQNKQTQRHIKLIRRKRNRRKHKKKKENAY